MEMTGLFYTNRRQWGGWTFTFDVNCGRSPTSAVASLSMTNDSGSGSAHSLGIMSYATKNTPVSDERRVDFGPFWWNWRSQIFDETMTQVTFACRTGRGTGLMGRCQVTFFEL